MIGEGTPDVSNIPFVSVPSVFRLEPQGIRGMRVIYNNTSLPQDRESLYWLNIYEIPPEKKDAAIKNSILVTMNTQMKLLYRPSGIRISPEKAIEGIACHHTYKNTLRCSNSSPINLSVIAVYARSASKTIKSVDDDLLMAPFSDREFHFNEDFTEKTVIILKYINDAGEQLSYTIDKK